MRQDRNLDVSIDLHSWQALTMRRRGTLDGPGRVPARPTRALPVPAAPDADQRDDRARPYPAALGGAAAGRRPDVPVSDRAPRPRTGLRGAAVHDDLRVGRRAVVAAGRWLETSRQRRGAHRPP